VLDCGCGIGTLKRLLPNNEYTGFDYSPRAVRIACKTQGTGTFMAADARQMKNLFNDNEFDVVVMRHFLENQEDWKEVIRQAFRICNKKVIINMRRPFGDSRLVEQKEDTWVWDMDYLDFNGVCRDLSVSVSFGKVGDEEFVIINKHLDKAVFDLDDECDELSALPQLLKLKEKLPKLKVTLFAIPSKISQEHINKLKQYDWIELGVHGWFHDTEHGRATECNYWTDQLEELCKKYDIELVPAWGSVSDFSYYHDCDGYIHISRKEGMPNTVLEALAYGLPCIVTNYGGAKEAVGDAGIIIQNDPEGVAWDPSNILPVDEILFKEAIAAFKANLSYLRVRTRERVLSELNDYIAACKFKEVFESLK